ncbi:MAG: SGNH/GDSL hydrolase family protein [Clostridia bacterium]|nr:SGNH/GDSL hydrolase family protein [Clostridia bacterium]
MIFHHIDFHNVAEVEPYEGGWRLWRVPADVRARANEKLRETTAAYSTGIELRFLMISDSVTIRLRSVPIAEGQMAYLYFGSLQGGWQQSSWIIRNDVTDVTISRPGNMAQLQQVTQTAGLPFSPEVVRLVLPYGNIIFHGVEGQTAAPAEDLLPKTTLLSYGSSITHGSLALAAPYTYPFRIAQKLGCDYLNRGFAGTALCDRAIAEWLVSCRDWHFATLEMGVNMLGMTEKEFEERVDTFTGIFADDGRPVFATSIFRCGGELTGEAPGKADVFRRIVRKYAEKRLHFIDGLELLERPEFLSQDMVHPSLEGISQIADRWHTFIRQRLPETLI